jgi:hypothetical protein
MWGARGMLYVMVRPADLAGRATGRHPASAATRFGSCITHAGLFVLFAVTTGLHLLARFVPALSLAAGRPRGPGDARAGVPGGSSRRPSRRAAPARPAPRAALPRQASRGGAAVRRDVRTQNDRITQGQHSLLPAARELLAVCSMTPLSATRPVPVSHPPMQPADGHARAQLPRPSGQVSQQPGGRFASIATGSPLRRRRCCRSLPPRRMHRAATTWTPGAASSG